MKVTAVDVHVVSVPFPPRRGGSGAVGPDLDVLIGSDDTVLEVAVTGAEGWVSGYTNAFPRAYIDLYQAAMGENVAVAAALYRRLYALLRWDSPPEFVQAIKLSMDVVGRGGGRCRPPRTPLRADDVATVRELTGKAVADGLA